MTLGTAFRDSGKSNVIRLKEIFPVATRNMIILRPSNLFDPDEWTIALASGLIKLSQKGFFKEKSIFEVGAGTGVNIAGLRTLPNPPAHIAASDLCADSIRVSAELARMNNWDVPLYHSDLLSQVPDMALRDCDQIIACIPQVPGELDLAKKDNMAHYYRPTGHAWDLFGLGLNARLLEQVAERAPQAGVTLNLSGRPGLERLRMLFMQHGYEPQVTHEAMVSQHMDTSLATLAQLEQNGCQPFEFFEDESGEHPMTAAEAEGRRLETKPVFHKIYVLTAPGRS